MESVHINARSRHWFLLLSGQRSSGCPEVGFDFDSYADLLLERQLQMWIS